MKYKRLTIADASGGDYVLCELVMNELIISYLNEYYNNPNPQYAVFIKGGWGCGKTYFIRKWLKQYSDTENGDGDSVITLKPIYVSLYGLKTTDDIKTAIDREINPFFYSKTGKFLKGVASILGKVVLKTSFDFDHNGKDDASFSGSIDSLSVFHSKDDVITGSKFIIFDDIERCPLDKKTLLGFINYFVEHCDCHVIIIGDDTKLREEELHLISDFKEKTIGREFSLLPDVECAVDGFLRESYISPYLLSERDYIVKCFRSTGSDNLRVLRQCLMDFSSQLLDVRIGKKDLPNAFLHGFLSSFIAVYAELNDKENRNYIEDYANFYQCASSYLDDAKGKALRVLNQKYYEVSLGNYYNVLSVEYVTRIVEHIKTGMPLTDFIKNNLPLKRRDPASWERLTKFWEMENDEFEAVYNAAKTALLKNQIGLPYQFGTTLGYLGYIDYEGVKKLAINDVSKVKQVIKNRFEACNDLESLFLVRSAIIQGINYVGVNANECPVLDDIRQAIKDSFERKKSTLPDKMQVVLRGLTDNNVASLSEVDDESYPDHSSAFQLRAIFEHEDAESLFNSICALSNKGKNEFCSFLAKHYLFRASIQGIEDRYNKDLPVLTDLKVRIEEKKKSSTGVDKLSYNRINESLEKSIRRCGGYNGPVEA